MSFLRWTSFLAWIDKLFPPYEEWEEEDDLFEAIERDTAAATLGDSVESKAASRKTSSTRRNNESN